MIHVGTAFDFVSHQPRSALRDALFPSPIGGICPARPKPSTKGAITPPPTLELSARHPLDEVEECDYSAIPGRNRRRKDLSCLTRSVVKPA